MVSRSESYIGESDTIQTEIRMYVCTLITGKGKNIGVMVKGLHPDYETAKVWCDKANEGHEAGHQWEPSYVLEVK